MTEPRRAEPTPPPRPVDPIVAALAFAIREAIAKREERRAKLTVVRGAKEEAAG